MSGTLCSEALAGPIVLQFSIPDRFNFGISDLPAQNFWLSANALPAQQDTRTGSFLEEVARLEAQGHAKDERSRYHPSPCSHADARCEGPLGTSSANAGTANAVIIAAAARTFISITSQITGQKRSGVLNIGLDRVRGSVAFARHEQDNGKRHRRLPFWKPSPALLDRIAGRSPVEEILR
jgi:hypothetical protein